MTPKTSRVWFVSALVITVLLGLFFIAGRSGFPLYAQEEVRAGKNDGILVVPIQIDRDNYGIAMVDTTAQTIWIYELNSRGPAHSRMRLLAARSWRYDRLLEQYNTDELKPQEVLMLLKDRDQKQPQQKNEHRVSDANSTAVTDPESGNLER